MKLLLFLQMCHCIAGACGGAAVLIERQLGRELIWLPCRHHVLERVMEGVFLEVMGPSTGPDPPIFKILENKWKEIDQTKFVTYKDYAESRKHLDSCVADIIEFAKKQIAVSFRPYKVPLISSNFIFFVTGCCLHFPD